jgi:hypothetical protein
MVYARLASEPSTGGVIRYLEYALAAFARRGS